MVQNVFNRYEKKYFLSAADYRNIRESLKPFMQEDAYGLHTIRNIYFDTETDELIRTSLEKPGYKEKFRVRCYGMPDEDSDVFLEIKKKYMGVVNKRRAVLSVQEARAYLKDGVKPKQSSQILREIDYFKGHYKLQSKLYLAYDRSALFGTEDPEFRVTFDTNIRCRNDRLEFSDDEDTTYLLEPGCCLMEVKIANALPLWFVKILTELKIQEISFSKYGTAYKRNLAKGYYDYVNAVPAREGRSGEIQTDTGRVCVC